MANGFDPTPFAELDETQLGVDRIATSPTALALYRNLIAAMQGAEGAPRLHQAALQHGNIPGSWLADAAVTRPKLSTATGSSSGNTQTPPNRDNINMHAYALFPSIVDTGGVAQLVLTGKTSNDNVDNPGFGTRGFDGASTYSVRWRYIQASPPYDLGDGEVVGFVYVRLDDGGEAQQVWMAPDPPWDGLPDDDALRAGEISDVLEGRMTLREAANLARARCAPDRSKLAGMRRRPHPFSPDARVILVDPMSEEVADLIALNDAGAPPRELFRMFSERYLEIDNEPLLRAGPPGVAVHRARFRNTGRAKQTPAPPAQGPATPREKG